MSRSSRSPQAATASASTAQASAASPSRRGLFIAVGAAAAVAAALGGLALWGGVSTPATRAALPELNRSYAPMLGEPSAKVHIVEFLDPACETCAAFYPVIKQIMADNPGRIRLSLRHVPFHKGVDEVVRMLEASRAQGKYFEALELLLARQQQWAPNHTAQAGLALQVLSAGVPGLDIARLQADMRSPEVEQRLQQDTADAKALQVKATPEYFVNGRQMESFGRQQLTKLVRDALQAAY